MSRPPRITASTPAAPPRWAVLQRHLFDVLDEAWRVFADRYTGNDGRLIYDGPLEGRDGVDDFYEPFFNWPMLYVLGGSDDVLAAAKQGWYGVTRQLTERGMLVDGFERGYDWFHQGESLLTFYGLCLADPTDEAFRGYATRFADLYLPGGPGNYDPDLRIIRAPHNGAGGPRWGLFDGPGYDPGTLRRYGRPLDWLGELGPQRLAEEMNTRMGRGDIAVNLAATSLAANAYLTSGDERYRTWLLDYVDGWMQRLAGRDGVLPDNVGLSGEVGEYLGGRWYGGHYGWSWPHGLYSVAPAAIVAGVNAALVSGDDRYLDLGRGPLDLALRHAGRGFLDEDRSTLAPHWRARLGEEYGRELLLVPYRVGDGGWFDEHPMQVAWPAALWCHSQDAGDGARLRRLRADGGYDWRAVRAFRDKEEAGHEPAWLAYLAGDNPAYPEELLTAATAQVARRLALIDQDSADPATLNVHHWQRLNPVVTEALLQLTCGAPQVLYNGGLPQARVRYYDADRRRPGLPPHVAALVSGLDPAASELTLVNLHPTATRRVLVQGGTFGEHRIEAVRHDTRTSPYPGEATDYVAPAAASRSSTCAVGGPTVEVVLPPSSEVRAELSMTLRGCPPSYRMPWDGR